MNFDGQLPDGFVRSERNKERIRRFFIEQFDLDPHLREEEARTVAHAAFFSKPEKWRENFVGKWHDLLETLEK